jgi:hypothetical protein
MSGDSLFFDPSYDDETIDNFLSNNTRNDSICYAQKKNKILYQIRRDANNLFQQQTSTQDRIIIDSLSNELNKDVVAGIFKSLGKEVPVYNYDRQKYRRKKSLDSLFENPYLRLHRSKDSVLLVNNIVIRTDYNRISRISIVGTLRYRDTLSKRDTTMEITFTNSRYSISLSGLNGGEYALELPVLSRHSPWINLADVIQYQPFATEHSYIVANQSLAVPIGGQIQVKKRKLSDYISFRTFFDPLGFLSDNPNGFAQLEGDAIIPMGLRSTGRWTAFPQAKVNFSYIYSNSINSQPRIAKVFDLRNNLHPGLPDSLLKLEDTSRFINNLDYIRYSYYQFRTNFSLLAIEIAKWNCWMHVEAGIRVSGSKVDTTSERTTIVHKLMPELRLRLEIRPDYIMGADMSVGIAFLGNTHEGNNPPSNIDDLSFLYKSKVAIPHEVNVYAVTGSGNGGLFFRYAGWLAFTQKFSDKIDISKLPQNIEIKKTTYFPQILIGYSTNLSALVNRIPKQKGY